MKSITLQLLAALSLLAVTAACTPDVPSDQQPPPAPQAATTARAPGAQSTALRDAINQPLDRAKAVEGTVQEAADRRRAASDAQD